MTPSTVSRQLGTLAASGLVERVDATGQYRLGIRLVHLANAVLARLDVREVARPHLVALVDATGETAALGSRRRGRDHRRLRSRLAPDPASLEAGAAVDRPCDLGGEGDARLLRPRASGRPVPRVHDPHGHGSPSTGHRDRGGARARLRAQPAGASPGSPRSRRRSARPVASSRRSSPSRAECALRCLRRRHGAPLLLERERVSRELGWASAVASRRGAATTPAALGGERKPIGERTDAGAQLLGPADREAAAEAGEDARCPVERTDTDPEAFPRPPRSARRASREHAARLPRGGGRAASTSQRHGVRASDVET